MSGHSKWNNIKGKKAAEDAKKSKIFCQIAKNIRIAVRSTGIGDPNANPSLRIAMEKAKQANMPNENVQRAIERGLGRGEGGQLEEVTYEAYAAGGVGFMIIVRTDNKQRTGAEIRHMIDLAGGSLGGPGSTTYLFQRSGNDFSVTIPLEITDAEQAQKVRDLYDELEAHDDVEAVYMNAVFPGDLSGENN